MKKQEIIFLRNKAKWIDDSKAQKGLYDSKLYWRLSYFSFYNYCTYLNFCFCFFDWYSDRSSATSSAIGWKICTILPGIKKQKSITKKQKCMTK